MGCSAVEWLPYLQPTGAPRTVYVAHQYAPHQYTHQWWEDLGCGYPGGCDVDWDGEDEPFDRAWLEDLLSTVGDFAATHGVPVAVNEFGVMRWEPGAADFMDDQMDLFEQHGINYALWVWDPAWEPWREEIDEFNFRHGPDPPPPRRRNVERPDGRHRPVLGTQYEPSINLSDGDDLSWDGKRYVGQHSLAVDGDTRIWLVITHMSHLPWETGVER